MERKSSGGMQDLMDYGQAQIFGGVATTGNGHHVFPGMTGDYLVATYGCSPTLQPPVALLACAANLCYGEHLSMIQLSGPDTIDFTFLSPH